MNNWIQKYEQIKDEKRENELKRELMQLLKKLDNAYTNKEKAKIIEQIIKIYEQLKIEAYEYDNKDYISKIKELKEIKYKLMEEKYQEEKESQSWNDYREKELQKENSGNEEVNR